MTAGASGNPVANSTMMLAAINTNTASRTIPKRLHAVLTARKRSPATTKVTTDAAIQMLLLHICHAETGRPCACAAIVLAIPKTITVATRPILRRASLPSGEGRHRRASMSPTERTTSARGPRTVATTQHALNRSTAAMRGLMFEVFAGPRYHPCARLRTTRYGSRSCIRNNHDPWKFAPAHIRDGLPGRHNVIQGRHCQGQGDHCRHCVRTKSSRPPHPSDNGAHVDGSDDGLPNGDNSAP